MSRAWDKEKKSRVPTKNRSQTFGFHTRSRKREIFWCFLFFFIVVVVCFSFIIGNLLISYVNVRAIGKECTLTGKEVTSGNFCCVCFSKIKIPYILTKPCNFPCPFSNLKFSFLSNFLETYRGNRWAQNQYLLDTGEKCPPAPPFLAGMSQWGDDFLFP